MTGGKKKKKTTRKHRTPVPAPRIQKPALEEDSSTDIPDATPVEIPVAGRSAATLMPVSAEAKATLASRAVALAAEKVEETDTLQFHDFIQFRLGRSAAFGIPAMNLDEVMYAERIAPVPCTPPFFTGVINRKGRLLAILDLGIFFGLSLATGTDASENRIIVVHDDHLQLGLLVAAVENSGRYRPDRLAPPLPMENGVGSGHVAGIWDGTISMLDIGALLSDASLEINEIVI